MLTKSVKATRRSEDTSTLPFIDKITFSKLNNLGDPPRDFARRFLELMGKIPEGESNRACLLEHFMQPSWRYLEKLYDAVGEFVEKFEIHPDELRTSSLPKVQIESADGKINFRNIGHLLTRIDEIYKISVEEHNKLNKVLKCESIVNDHSTPIHQLAYTLHVRSTEMDSKLNVPEGYEYPEKRFYSEKHRRVADYHLTSLAIRARTQDQIERGFFGNRSANEIFREACIQRWGGIPENFFMALKDSLFCDEQGKRFETGKTLFLSEYGGGNPDPQYPENNGIIASFERKIRKQFPEDCLKLTRPDLRRELVSNDSQTENPDTSFHLVLQQPRKSTPDEQIIRLPALDKFRNLKLLSADQFIEKNRARYKNNVKLRFAFEEAESKVSSEFYGVVDQFIKNTGIDLKTLRTSSEPNLKLANSKGEIIFESLGHMLSRASEFEEFVIDEYQKLVETLKVERNWSFSEAEGAVEKLFALAESYGHKITVENVEDQPFVDPARGVQAFANLSTLNDCEIKFPEFRAKAQPILFEACMQLKGEISEVALQAVQKHTFCDDHGKVFCSGRELIEAVRGHLKDVGRPYEDVFIVEFLQELSDRRNSLSEHNAVKVEDTSMPIIPYGARIPAEGEKVLCLQSLDAFQDLKCLSCEQYLRENSGTISEGSDPEDEFFEKQSEAGSAFYDVLVEFIEKTGIDSNLLRTSSMPDLKLANSRGEILFESLGHLFSRKSECSVYSYGEYEKLIKKLRVEKNWDGPNEGAIRNLIDIACFYGHPIQGKLEITNSGVLFRDEQINEQAFANLTTLNGVDTKSQEFKAKAPEILFEACSQLKGIVSSDGIAYLQKYTFCDDDGKVFCSGKELVAAVKERLKFEGRSYGNVAVAGFLYEVGKLRDPLSNKIEDTSLPIAPYEPRKPVEGEKFVCLPYLDKIEDLKLFSAKRFIKENRDKYLDGDGIRRAYDKHDMEVEMRFYMVFEDFMEATGIDSNTLRTSSLPDLKLANSKGEILFESLGHLFARKFECEQYAVVEYRKIIKSLRVPSNWAERHHGAFRLLHQAANHFNYTINGKTYYGGAALFIDEQSGVQAFANLTTLKGVDQQSAEFNARASTILFEACDQLKGRITEDAIQFVQQHTFCDDDGKVFCSGKELVLSVKAYLKDIGRPYSNSAVVAFLKEKGREQIKRETYQGVVSDLNVPTATLYLALCALGSESDRPRNFNRFRDRIIRSKAESTTVTTSPVRLFSKIVEVSYNEDQHIDRSELGKKRLADLLKQLCYRAYDGDLEKMLSEVSNYREKGLQVADPKVQKIIDEALDELCPYLQKLFMRTKEFKDPKTKIRVTLFQHQREAVVGALAFSKPLFILGTGTGKTETCAALCETIAPPGVLWCTKGASRKTTADRLRDEILTDPKGVVEFKPSDVHKSEAEIRNLLDGSRYVVIGYDTLRQLMNNHPDKYVLVQEWVKDKVKILDEAQVIDNDQSGRSLALQGLRSEHTFVATGTPYQHRAERSATLLHLAMPHIYPDPAALAAEFKQDKDLARARIHSHATVYTLEDVAQPFESPNVKSFKEQLATGIPRIPKLITQRVPYALSLEHGRIYADQATNFDAWAAETNHKKGPLQQIAHMERLLYNPEKLGAAPPYALIDAVKKIAIPAMQRGEKVLIFGQHVHILELLSKDPEIQSYGLSLLTGAVDSDKRSNELKRLEDDPALMCGIGQFQAVGSSHNCRSVEHVIFLERPPLTSDLMQSLGRAVRLLTKGDERFAHEYVNAYFLEASLPQAVVAEVQEPKRKKYLERGTIYNHWLSRDLERLEVFRHFASRGGGSAATKVSSVQELLNELSGAIKTFSDERTRYELLCRKDIGQHIFRYSNPIKKTWREEELGAFVRTWIHALNKDPKDIKLALLPGPEALEIMIYLELGILPQNIFAFEGGADPRIREYCRGKVVDLGCQFFASKLEQVLPHMDTVFDIVSADPDGYLTGTLFNMFLTLKLSDRAMVLKNTLSQREKGDAKNLILEAGGDRSYLDAFLVKLVSTADLHAHGMYRGPDAVKVASFTRVAARAIADRLSDKIDVSPERLRDLIGEVYLGSPHIKGFDQVRYISPGGSPFLSSFAVIEKWNNEQRGGDAATKLRSCIGASMRQSLYLNERPRSEQFNVESDGGVIHLEYSGGGTDYEIRRDDLISLCEYYQRTVADEFSMAALLKREPRTVGGYKNTPGIRAAEFTLLA